MYQRQTSKKLKETKKTGDDSLFGLLSSYKIYNTFFRILVSEEDDKIVVQVTGNPKHWNKIPEEKYAKYTRLRRLEMDMPRLIIKYISPEHLIVFYGSVLGSRIPSNKATIINNLDNDGYFILETSIRYRQTVIQGIRKLISLSPQKKYEILEKFFIDSSKG